MASLTVFTLVPDQARGLNFNLSYSDPASDVTKLYTGNMTPVVVNGEFVMSPFPDEVNILWLRSRESGLGGENITLEVEVKGKIVDLWNTTYTLNLYTNQTNATHYVVNYTNGTTWLLSNSTAFSPINITDNSTIGGVNNNTLFLAVSKSLLGNITAFNIDGTAIMIGDPYSYRDFGWEVPGHPGTAPATIQGHVYESGTSTPIEGANVSTDVGGFWTLTDAHGAYSLLVSPGTYNVTASRDGYQSNTGKVSVNSGDVIAKDFYLGKAGTIPSLGALEIVVAVSTATILVALRRRKR